MTVILTVNDTLTCSVSLTEMCVEIGKSPTTRALKVPFSATELLTL